MDALSFRMPTRLDATWVEDVHEQCVADTPGALDFDVVPWERTRALAEDRLLGLLREAREAERPLGVQVGGLSVYDRDHPSQRWLLFRDTLAAAMVMSYADQVVDREERERRDEIVRVQFGALIRGEGTLSYGKEVAVVDFSSVASPPPGRLLMPMSPRMFGTSLRAMVRRMGLPPLADKHLGDLTRFGWEAVDNIHRHATFDLARRRIDGLRFLLLRRINLDQEGVEELERAGAEPLADYIRQLKSLLRDEVEHAPLVELTVADSGLGIAATLAKRENVYAGSPDVEREVLQRAMQPGESSKPARDRGSGQGLDKAIQATRKLRGLIAVRSGRFELYRHHFETGQGWRYRQRSHLPGTSISLIFPWSDQTQLPLFGEAAKDE